MGRVREGLFGRPPVVSSRRRASPAETRTRRLEARAWAVARLEAARLKRRGFEAVAVSGSLARGDFGAGSDVDLWAVGPSSGRDEGFVRGLPVTVFRSTPAELVRLAWYARWDVPQLHVLFDGGGHFATLARRYRRHAADLRAWAEAETRGAVADASRLASSRWAREAQQGRRMLAWLAFAVPLWRATGLRIPGWRHAQAVLTPARLEALRRTLGLTLPPSGRRAALRWTRRAPRAVERYFAGRFGEVGLVTRWAGTEAKLARGSAPEALLKLRADLERWVAGPARQRLPGVDVARELDAHAAPSLAALFRLAHGFRPRVAPPADAEVRW